MTNPGGAAGAATASAWLFGLSTLAPLLAFVTVRRLLGFRWPVAQAR